MNPPMIESKEGERKAILEAARLMLLAVRTAPKSAGIDDILASVIYGQEKDAIAEEMENIGENRGIENFRRDAKNVRDSEAVVLVGVRGSKTLGLNCGACGYNNCKEFEQGQRKTGQDFTGPICLLKALDLGIALGSAAKTASLLNVDNRIMYRVGAAAMKLKLMPKATVIMGIPLSAKGKNIYFDRSK
jgi:uncharacterized ferredoxin-like protein